MYTIKLTSKSTFCDTVQYGTLHFMTKRVKVGDTGSALGKSIILKPVLRIRIRIRIHRIHMFLGLQDPDPLVRGMDPDPDPALDLDPSIIMQK